ncbi:menaquinone biosynthesis decarboxylase [Thermodesulfobium sp. 4217-1]|uniref:menaquinone biosynthesis decarboxylase n=1 Tax=Thermodesulfobium sp. 4217-1 TaxID=3120013 RepID=UPI0032220389
MIIISAFSSLGEYIAFLEKRNELKRIRVEVDRYLEITEIADRFVKVGGPALYFENVKDSKFPLAINVFGTWDRVVRAIGNPDDIAKKIDELLKLPTKKIGFWDTVRSLPNIVGLMNIKPKIVNKAPCQEVILRGDQVNLNDLPVLHCWPLDGGPFITLPLVMTQDPESKERNLGMYRMQVFDRNTTGMHWHHHKDGARHFSKLKPGERMNVAVAIGADPATIYSATAPLPPNVDEFVFAGFLRGSGVEMVKALNSDILVPAQAEFVLEGYVVKGELRREGPFGDHTGFYSLEDDFPVFHVECITHRKNPVYVATIVGRPPMEDAYLGKATERIFLPMLKMTFPEIVDLNLPIEGVFHNLAIVSIKKQYPGHARKVMHALWGLGQMSFTKFIVVVDEDVNVHDMSYVRWKALNNVDPERDIEIVKGPVDVLDHAAPYPRFGSKMGIDATKKMKEEGLIREFPPDIVMGEDIRNMVSKRWQEYGF